MKAFKTFNQCPNDQKPTDIVEEWPWQVQDCGESDTLKLQQDGFTVLTEEDYVAYLAQHQTLMDSWQSSRIKVPISVTPRQMRIALVSSGITLSTIDAMINSLPEPQKSITRITWEYSIEFQRSNPILNAMAPALGLSSAQVDELFALASTL